jgi:hypothetical protein
MGSLRKYFWIILIVVTAGITVLLRSTGTGHFRYDAARRAEPSSNGANLITPERLSLLEGNIMVINLAEDRNFKKVYPSQIAASPDTVLTKKWLKKINSHKGPVVLYSGDQAISARIWMVMSQSGIKDLYILSHDTLNESLKEKFRTDTLIRPEL